MLVGIIQHDIHILELVENNLFCTLADISPLAYDIVPIFVFLGINDNTKARQPSNKYNL